MQLRCRGEIGDALGCARCTRGFIDTVRWQCVSWLVLDVRPPFPLKSAVDRAVRAFYFIFCVSSFFGMFRPEILQYILPLVWIITD